MHWCVLVHLLVLQSWPDKMLHITIIFNLFCINFVDKNSADNSTLHNHVIRPVGNKDEAFFGTNKFPLFLGLLHNLSAFICYFIHVSVALDSENVEEKKREIL